jgi:hypothetical protein
MSKLAIILGNLLDATEDFKCHQCNCVTTKSKGLSAVMFSKFPSANTYKRRRLRKSVPGTIDVFLDCGVINLYAQYLPGKATEEEKESRLWWFELCLQAIIDHLPPHQSYAFPYGIGCGLAGGKWEDYIAALENFAKHEHIQKVTIYKM